MTGFLDDMARSSAARVAQALRHELLDALERRARHAPAGPPLRLSASGFDVIAELKLRSPAAGVLGAESEDWLGRISAYARGGAAAVSVLTEPLRFDGSLEHLRRAAQVLSPLGVPAMRKDFLVDPYQVLEARAAGAGGVLVILRMLQRARIEELLAVAAEHGLFVLLEAFDEGDLEVARDLIARRAAGGADGRGAPILIGVNSRDLQTLKVRQERFATLAALLPGGCPAVAESGVATAADARHMQQLGYGLALIGTALMSCEDPSQLLHEILAATRTVQA
ncbi:MAG TPA: indole-3-glycerol phosphate synthase TrpC [Burkholderiales bacterium]|nr:indole-3-glycerol phosphate synthase TrpC [Burkholderiales bacterium]